MRTDRDARTTEDMLVDAISRTQRTVDELRAQLATVASDARSRALIEAAIVAETCRPPAIIDGTTTVRDVIAGKIRALLGAEKEVEP